MPGQAAEILYFHFRFRFPDDFFKFGNLVQELARRGISLSDSPLGISLANLFDVFREDAVSRDPEALETRFYKDPPEFVTLLVGDTDGLHWGYYVDDPKSTPFPVVHYYHNDAFELTLDGDLFDAVANHAHRCRQTSEDYLVEDPENAAVYREDLRRLDTLLEVVEPYRRRVPLHRPVTARTRDGLGIVVPPGQYRPLFKDDPFARSDYVPTEEEVRGYRQAALDALRAGYPGTALKLGKDLWDYRPFFPVSYELLAAAYGALNRPVLKERLDRIRDFRQPAS